MKTQTQLAVDVTSSSNFNAVYRQCWPQPSTFRRRDCFKIHHNSSTGGNHVRQPQSKSFESSFNYEDLTRSLPLREKISPSIGHKADLNQQLESENGRIWYRPTELKSTTTLRADLGLDQGTLHWKTWRNFKEDLDDTDHDDTELYKITQDTFRQLTRQVREVSMHMNKKYTGCGLKSYHSSNPYQSLVNIHPSQLAANLPTHSPSIRDDRNQTNPDAGPSVEIVCTPMKKAERKQRPQSHHTRTTRRRIVAPGRPKSSQPSSESESHKGNYDHLSSRVLGKFVADLKETEFQECLGPFEIVAKGYFQQFVESSDSEEEDGEEFSKEARNQYSTTDLENLWWGKFRQEKEYMQKKLLGVKLLPEVFNPEDSFFEYRSSNASSPEPDPLPEALSEPFCYMDLLELSQEKDWRQAVRRVPEEEDVELIMDRLIEMEVFQEETLKLERKESIPPKKSPSQLEDKKGWNADAAKPTERAQSALGRKSKSKNCSVDCLQPACSGDCKHTTGQPKGCLHCLGRHCKGQCTEFGYHLHVRRPRENRKRKPRPKSCISCIKRGKKVLNPVNANNVILGRPRSAFSTFSSAQQTRGSKQSNRMSYTNENDGGLISQRLKQLQLSAPMEQDTAEETTESPSLKVRLRRVKSARPLKGRDTLLAGKAYNSQRRTSITTETCSTSAASCNSPALRAQSAKLRRRRIKSTKR